VDHLDGITVVTVTTDETVTTVDKKRKGENPVVKLGFAIALVGVSIAYAELGRELMEESLSQLTPGSLGRLLAR
jgi:hypothetical protein